MPVVTVWTPASHWFQVSAAARPGVTTTVPWALLAVTCVILSPALQVQWPKTGSRRLLCWIWQGLACATWPWQQSELENASPMRGTCDHGHHRPHRLPKHVRWTDVPDTTPSSALGYLKWEHSGTECRPRTLPLFPVSQSRDSVSQPLSLSLLSPESPVPACSSHVLLSSYHCLLFCHYQ
jgi:hypothetical protein